MNIQDKVFCVGIWKTGTKSFGQACSMLGYRVHSHFWPISIELGGDPELDSEILEKIKKVSNDFNAFSDSPWLGIYKHLYEWYPDAKFVLTLRESSDNLAESEYWHAKAHNQPEEEMPGKEFWIKRYEDHNKSVREFFKDKPGSLLEMCFETGDGWEKLLPFLGYEVPSVLPPFPHTNKRRITTSETD